LDTLIGLEQAPAPSLPTDPASPPRLAVIYNPTAGGARLRRYRAVLDRLADAGCPLLELPTHRRGDAERFAAELTHRDCDRVVVAGGDGTINEVANGLVSNPTDGRSLPLALLPIGTANVIAREIGLPVRPADIARCIAGGRPRPIALGRANGRCFVIMVGAGFDAHVVARVTGRLKHLLGKGAYAWQTLVHFRRFAFPTYRVEIGGRNFEVASVIVANGHFYGGPFVVCPNALLEIPSLEVCLFRSKGPFHALRYATAMVLGFLPRLPDIEIVTTTRLRVFGPRQDPLQGDGDIIAALPCEIEVLPDALDLIFPR